MFNPKKIFPRLIRCTTIQPVYTEQAVLSTKGMHALYIQQSSLLSLRELGRATWLKNKVKEAEQISQTPFERAASQYWPGTYCTSQREPLASKSSLKSSPNQTQGGKEKPSPATNKRRSKTATISPKSKSGDFRALFYLSSIFPTPKDGNDKSD
ncbi:hypothetical protein EJ02DRAFT_458596 [Clathrospora elynae]|uniref:Uncharacterized protein n=1 Tax=Clathrospora elynae TaxID=706981 RepID=A0A6A5SDK5_9PLEO|nr:hypothetical protein EJ02DRAFT_458596 [Clathrospora elynae]